MSAPVRIAVFYDGSYFQQVTNHYRYGHEIGRRIDLGGLHDFVRWRVSKLEDYPKAMCQIVEAHYFRGRFSLSDLEDKAERDQNPGFVEDFLRGERVFDQLLAQHNITPHYLRIDTRQDPPREKGVDVAMALEAFDVAVTRKLDWVALITADADYLPLVRKLGAIGARVMLLGWEFPGRTVVSKALFAEAADAIAMAQLIEQGIAGFDVDTLFVAD
jgi:uncharacterized LabA/DUF88 family protein